jgi:hypothetical protein
MSVEDDDLRLAFAGVDLRDGPRPSADEISALVAGDGDEAARLATLAALVATPQGRRELTMVRALHAGVLGSEDAGMGADAQANPATIAFPVPRLQSWPQWMRPAALAAAALVVTLIGIERLSDRSNVDSFRSVAPTLPLVSPTEGATIATSARFSWRAITGASYELEVFTADGRPLARLVTGDTVLNTTLPPRSDLRWWVTARLEDGTQLRSATRRVLVR